MFAPAPSAFLAQSTHSLYRFLAGQVKKNANRKLMFSVVVQVLLLLRLLCCGCLVVAVVVLLLILMLLLVSAVGAWGLQAAVRDGQYSETSTSMKKGVIENLAQL